MPIGHISQKSSHFTCLEPMVELQIWNQCEGQINSLNYRLCLGLIPLQPRQIVLMYATYIPLRCSQVDEENMNRFLEKKHC